MFIKIISAILAVFLIISCVPKKEIKEEAKETVAPPPEDIKLPELPQKPKEPDLKKGESVKIEKDAEEKYVILNFDNADIETVISTVGELLSINYILGPGVTGKITIQSYRKFPVRDLFQIFQTILEVNGLTAVKDGVFYKIVPIDAAKQQPVSVQTGKELKLQLDSSFITQIIPLEYVKASDVANIIRNLMPRGTDLIVYEPTNLLIVTAPPAGLVKFMKILEAVDIPALDRESVKTFVYYVENGEAKKLADLLKSLYVEKKDSKSVTKSILPAPPLAPKISTTSVAVEGGLPGEVEGDLVVTAYEDRNALLIKSTPRSYLAIMETLKKLDIPVKQVLIEVLVAEVTLSDKTQFGLEWLAKGSTYFEGNRSSVVGGFANSPFNFVESTKDSSGTVTSFTTNFTPVVSSGLFANVLDSAHFNVLISALATTGNLNVLASPHILAVDNKEAKIEIGSEVPIATGMTQQPSTATAGTTLVTTGQIQYKTIGTILTVTPHITEKKQVTMKITQEASGLGEAIKVAGQDFQGFNTRKATTTAVVQDGHTLIIGGLIEERKSKSRSGIPLLSKIPILGYLFGTTTDEVRKTELLVMVTPHVISSTEEAEALTKDFQNKVTTIKERLDQIQPVDVLKDKKFLEVDVAKDASLMELVETNGYVLKDENTNFFLKEFMDLNVNIKSIRMIPKGSSVKLPLKYLEKPGKKG